MVILSQKSGKVYKVPMVEDVQITYECKDFFGAKLVFKGLELKKPCKKYCEIADQKVTSYCFFFLQIYWACVQLGFHDPERFFNPPKIMIRFIYFLI